MPCELVLLHGITASPQDLFSETRVKVAWDNELRLLCHYVGPSLAPRIRVILT